MTVLCFPPMKRNDKFKRAIFSLLLLIDASLCLLRKYFQEFQQGRNTMISFLHQEFPPSYLNGRMLINNCTELNQVLKPNGQHVVSGKPLLWIWLLAARYGLTVESHISWYDPHGKWKVTWGEKKNNFQAANLQLTITLIARLYVICIIPCLPNAMVTPRKLGTQPHECVSTRIQICCPWKSPYSINNDEHVIYSATNPFF